MLQFNGNVAHVANHLGRQWAVISRTLRRYEIDPADYRPAGSPEGNPEVAADAAFASQILPASHSTLAGPRANLAATAAPEGRVPGPALPSTAPVDDDPDEDGDTLG